MAKVFKKQGCIYNSNGYICTMALKKAYPLLENTDPWICTASKLALSIRSVNVIYRKHLKKHKVTMSQLSLLMVIGKMVSVPQSEVGKMLKLEKSTITRDLKRLIDKGYIVKNGPANRPIVEITDKGAAYTEKIIPDWRAATDEALAILDNDGEQALNLVLNKLTK